MQTLFNDKPVLGSIVKAGILIFIGLSLINLYYSIRINRVMYDKLNEKA